MNKRGKTIISLMLLGLIAGLQVATQYTAWAIDYQIESFKITHKIYFPWAIVVWYNENKHIEEAIYTFKKAGSYGLLTYIGTFLPYTFWSILNPELTKTDDMHGSAKLADKEEIKSFLKGTGEHGIQLGAYDDNGKHLDMVHNGAEHTLIVAPTRAGKGISTIIPTIFRWQSSQFILDIKGENFEITSERKKAEGYKVIKFAPTGEHSHHFNPLDTIRWNNINEIKDVQNIATYLIPDGNSDGRPDHFADSARRLIAGVIVLAYEMKKKQKVHAVTFYEVDSIIGRFKRGKEEVIEEFINSYGHNDFVKAALSDILSLGSRELGSVYSTATNALDVFRDPLVAENTEKSSFDIKEFLYGERPIIVYMIIPPSDIDRLTPLRRIMVSSIINILTSEGTGKDRDYDLLMLLDEFPTLQKMSIMESSPAYVAGYGIRFLIVIQNYEQLYKYYTENEVISGNCHIVIAYAPTPSSIKTATKLSQMTGETTIIKKSLSTSRSPMAFAADRISENFQEVKRSLLTPHEVVTLKGATKEGEKVLAPGEILIFVSGKNVTKGKQTPWFLHPKFKSMFIPLPES